jgi:hypothetical protein
VLLESEERQAAGQPWPRDAAFFLEDLLNWNCKT